MLPNFNSMNDKQKIDALIKLVTEMQETPVQQVAKQELAPGTIVLRKNLIENAGMKEGIWQLSDDTAITSSGNILFIYIKIK